MSLSSEFIPFGKGVRIVAEHPCGLIAIEKPCGIQSHPNPNCTDENRSKLILGNYCFDEEAFHVRVEKGGIRRVYLLNRLDAPTSGVLLIALDFAIAEVVRKLFANAQVSKRYFALIRGRGLRYPSGTWSDAMSKSTDASGGVRSSVGHGGLAVTDYSWQCAASGSLPLSLIRLNPKTGRTHQLRVQTAIHGHPILGDRTYGNFEFNKTVGSSRGFKRLFLHSESTFLSFDWSGTKVDFQAVAPLPNVFNEALGVDEKNYREMPKTPRRTHNTSISQRLRIRI